MRADGHRVEVFIGCAEKDLFAAEVIFLITFAHRYRIASRLTVSEMLAFCRNNLLLYRRRA